MKFSTGWNPEVHIGTLTVHCVHTPFPHHIRGKFHILLAHLRQLHLTYQLLCSSASSYDVYFVDQLSTCIPALRLLAHKRVVFYCHFSDKLLANGEFVEGNMTMRGSLLKRAYCVPMDWLEEITIRESPRPQYVIALKGFRKRGCHPRQFKFHLSRVQGLLSQYPAGTTCRASRYQSLFVRVEGRYRR